MMKFVVFVAAYMFSIAITTCCRYHTLYSHQNTHVFENQTNKIKKKTNFFVALGLFDCLQCKHHFFQKKKKG